MKYHFATKTVKKIEYNYLLATGTTEKTEYNYIVSDHDRNIIETYMFKKYWPTEYLGCQIRKLFNYPNKEMWLK